MAGWQFANGGLAAGNVGNAPVYDDVLSTFLGQTYFTPGKYDPALAMTLNAGGKGSLSQGLDAFIAHGSDDTTNPLMAAANAGYRTQDLKNLATGFGIDPNSENLEQVLRDRTKDYYGIGGMSAGWNPTGDARQGNQTLYQRQDGKLVPIQTNTGVYPEKGSYIEEHPGVLAPLAVVGGGLLAAYMGAGAAAAGGAASSAGGGAAAGAGITGTAGASSAAAYGAMPAAWGGFAGSTGLGAAGLGSGFGAGLGVYGGLGAGYLGGAALTGGAGSAGGSMFGQAGDWYNSLPKYQQQALRGAGQNFVTSGGDPKAALQGGISGGLGGYVSGALGGMGAPGWLSNIGGNLAGKFGGGLAGALFGGGATGAGGGGSQSGAGAAQGGSGGSGMAGGVSGASGSGGTGAGGGLSGGWRMKSATDAANQSYLAQSYAPIVAEAQRKKLAEALEDGKGLSGWS